MDLSRPLENLLGESLARVLRRLAVVSGGLSGRRVAELAKVPVATASRVLSDLVEVGLVDGTDVGRSRLYRLNRDHVLWAPLEQMLAVPARIEQTAAESVREVVGHRATVALYGSFARGEAGRHSDVDIVIVWDDSVTDAERVVALDAINGQVAAATGNRVEVVELTDVDLRRMVKADDPLVDSWRRDARTVTGLDLKRRLEAAAS